MTKRKTRFINDNKRILIICEGDEEFDYIKHLKSIIPNWSNYDMTPKNAKGLDNIYSIYSYEFQQNNYDIIFVYCDTEMPPYEKYNKLKNNIEKNIYGKKVSKQLVFFANPCTMLIILSHFKKVKLTTNSKTQNSKIIQECTGVKDYDGSENKRKGIINKINPDNYIIMKNNLKDVSQDDSVIPSTNILNLFNNFDNKNKKWINSIISKTKSKN